MKTVLSFYDYTGEAVRPWAEAGYTCYCYDVQHEAIRAQFVGEGVIYYCHWNALNQRQTSEIVQWMMSNAHVAMVFGFPPCTDLAASGAKHWKKKAEADPRFQHRAVGMAMLIACIAGSLGAPYCIENPIGALSTLWRKPDYKFHPCDFGGYLPEDDAHPRWPEYIPSRDAYSKATCLWTGNGFVFPEMKKVEPISISLTKKDGSITTGSPQWAKLGGKSLKTKNIRSATPRGFAKAVFETNSNADITTSKAA